MAMEYRRVAIADLGEYPECVHGAWLDPDEHWNGWACPYFELDEVLKMRGWLEKWFNDTIRYDEATDTLTVYDWEELGSIEEEMTGIDMDGHHVYALGTGIWIWEIVDEME